MFLETLNEFNILKQGDTTSKFSFRVLNHDEESVNLTGQTIVVKMLSDINRGFEKTPEIDEADPSIIHFTISELEYEAFYGEIRLELEITDPITNRVMMVPSEGYYRFRIETSLDATNGGTVKTITLEAIETRLSVVEQSIMNNEGVTSYLDLTDKPSIPTKTSELQNDSGFVDSIFVNQTIADLDTDGVGGGVTSYNDLTDKPTIPTKVSELQNDLGLVDAVFVNQAITDINTGGGVGGDKTVVTDSAKNGEIIVDGAPILAYDDSEVSDRITTLENNPGGGMNYDDTELRNLIDSKAPNDHTHSEITTLDTRVTTLESAGTGTGDAYDDTAILYEIDALKLNKSDVNHTHEEIQNNDLRILALEQILSEGTSELTHTHTNQQALDALHVVNNKIGRFVMNDEKINPRMIADIQDGFVASASEVLMDKHYAYLAFDSSSSTYWTAVSTSGGTGHWLQLEFPEPTIVGGYKYYSPGDMKTTYTLKAWEVQGSIDGITFETIDVQAPDVKMGWYTCPIGIPKAYKFYRFLITNGISGGRVQALEFYGADFLELGVEFNNKDTLKHLNAPKMES